MLKAQEMLCDDCMNALELVKAALKKHTHERLPQYEYLSVLNLL